MRRCPTPQAVPAEHTALLYVRRGAALVPADGDASTRVQAGDSAGSTRVGGQGPARCCARACHLRLYQSVRPASVPVQAGRSALFARDGDTVALRNAADGRPCDVLLLSGAPLREPVALGGPIVINTRDELRQAYRELQDGTFLDV